MSDSEPGGESLNSDGVAWDDDPDDNFVSRQEVANAVVTDTDWTTETILSQLRRGNIQLNPRFQRRDAWDPKRKSRFIESVVLGYPIPQIVLAEDRNRRGAFIVLDGKQRLLALRQFAEGSSLGASATGEEFRRFKLRGLEVRPDLNGYDLARLETEAQAGRLDDVNALLNQTIRTVVVRRWPSEDFLNDVFLRLNTGSVALSPHELRQALHPGKFSDFIDDFAGESLAVRRALRIRTADFRMRDVELLLRYCAMQLYIPEYRGNLKAFLDVATERLNGAWDKDEPEIRRLARTFDDSIETTFKIFGPNSFFRWDSSGKRYERRFNRALFDAIMYHFHNPIIRASAENKATAVERALQELCELDSEFVKSIQTTTKSTGATFGRINTWGKVLSPIVGKTLPEPIPTTDLPK